MPPSCQDYCNKSILKIIILFSCAKLKICYIVIMKTTKDFNMSLYYTIITSASSHKRLLEDEQKKALSNERKDYLQAKISEQDHIIKTMEDNSSVFLGASIDNAQG